MTAGNGLLYYEKRRELSELYEMAPLRYGSGGGNISIAKTLALLPEFRDTLKENRARLEIVLDDFMPHVVVLDSFYVTSPMRDRSIPLIAVNNADFIIASYFKLGCVPPFNTIAQFFFIELMDFLFHKLYADLVLSPALWSSVKKNTGRFQTIAPLVRPGYKSQTSSKKPRNLLIMLSGSAFGSQVSPDVSECGLDVDVVGREKPTDWPLSSDQVRFHGKVIDNRTLVANADIAVVNCGYSAISEMIYARKPMVVLPVINHAEQWVNAKIVEKLGVGLIANKYNFKHALQKVIANYERHLGAYEKLEQVSSGEGAEDAALAIQKFARISG